MKAGGCQLGMGFEGWNILMAACKIHLFKVNVNLVELEGCILCIRRYFFFYLGKLVPWLFHNSWMQNGARLSAEPPRRSFFFLASRSGVLLWPEDNNPHAFIKFPFTSLSLLCYILVLHWWEGELGSDSGCLGGLCLTQRQAVIDRASCSSCCARSVQARGHLHWCGCTASRPEQVTVPDTALFSTH